MKRSELKNKANKTKDPKDISKYKKQLNYVVKLNNQSKQEHFDGLNPFLDSKPFWKSCKPYFSNKHSFGELKIAFNESDEVLTENMKIAKNLTHTLNQLQIFLNYSTSRFSQMSPVKNGKI